MHTGANGHEVSIRYFHGGIPGVLGRPHLASWLLYGLGSETQDLPAYMVLTDPGGHPVDGVNNWSSGFMPAAYQGTVLRTEGRPILNLDPPHQVSREMQRREIDLINRLNESHRIGREHATELAARIAAYELAFELQMTAPEALDLSQETPETLELYGVNEPKPDWHKLALGPSTFGRQCLVARRLVERGVRFVQIYSGGGHQQQNWDAHFGVEGALAPLDSERDQNAHVRAAGGQFTFKIVNAAEPASAMAFQTALLRHVEAAAPGLPLPRVVILFNLERYYELSPRLLLFRYILFCYQSSLYGVKTLRYH
jgi:hypothetical protein